MAVSISALDIAYRILEAMRANSVVEDSIDIRECISFTNNYRSLFLKQKYDKYPMAPVDEAYCQDLGAVPLEIVDSSNHATLQTNYKVVRTSTDIPLPIETSTGLSMFTRISPADRREQKFRLVHFNALPFVGSGKFNAHQIFAAQLGKRLYLYSKDPSFYEMKYINVRGVFGNPFEVMIYNSPTITLDAQWAAEYPINASMAEMIINTAIKELYRYTATGIQDTVNNQADDVVNLKR